MPFGDPPIAGVVERMYPVVSCLSLDPVVCFGFCTHMSNMKRIEKKKTFQPTWLDAYLFAPRTPRDEAQRAAIEVLDDLHSKLTQSGGRRGDGTTTRHEEKNKKEGSWFASLFTTGGSGGGGGGGDGIGGGAGGHGGGHGGAYMYGGPGRALPQLPT